MALASRIVHVRKERMTREASEPFDPEPYILACGEELRRCREVIGWSANDVGAKVGLTAPPILHFETGKGGLSLAKLLHIWAVLGIPLPYPFVPYTPTELAATCELLKRATPPIQAAIRQYLVVLDPPHLS